MVISFIPYIEAFSLRFDQSGFRFILEEWRPTICETETEDPSSLTELILIISDVFLCEQSVKYTDIKGCHRLFKWATHAGFFVSTWGGGETNVAPHLPRSET